MRAVVQRVNRADVRVDNKIIGNIKKGLLVYLGIGKEDDSSDIDYLVKKVIGLRIFEDNNEKMNLSISDINGEILVISQFTLYGDVRKGKRPSFTDSAHPNIGNDYYMKFVEKVKESGIKVQTGEFGAHMEVEYINDGPVTILIDSKKAF
ncbi:MAG: D-aminoacyl-tRNA deacylase [Gudongella sp.]|nr:D-aminoacyl-tRNA deacylase [Gudongella sp.]